MLVVTAVVTPVFLSQVTFMTYDPLILHVFCDFFTLMVMKVTDGWPGKLA